MNSQALTRTTTFLIHQSSEMKPVHVHQSQSLKNVSVLHPFQNLARMSLGISRAMMRQYSFIATDMKSRQED